MRWIDLVEQNAELAELGKKKLTAPGIVFVATVRRDGSPRVSPLNPHFWGDDLWLSFASSSHKADDITRDPRIVVHNAVASWDGSDGEFKARGRAIMETDRELYTQFRQVLIDRVGWGPDIDLIKLCKVDISDVTFINRAERPWDDPLVTRWPERA